MHGGLISRIFLTGLAASPSRMYGATTVCETDGAVSLPCPHHLFKDVDNHITQQVSHARRLVRPAEGLHSIPDRTEPEGDTMNKKRVGRLVTGDVSRLDGIALLPRGVWTAPFLGPRGEPILVAIDREHRHVRWVTVPAGCGLLDISDDLWAFLERADPEPATTPFTLSRVSDRPLLILEKA